MKDSMIIFKNMQRSLKRAYEQNGLAYDARSIELKGPAVTYEGYERDRLLHKIQVIYEQLPYVKDDAEIKRLKKIQRGYFKTLMTL